MVDSEDSVLDTVGIRDNSSSELDSTVEGREIEISPELTIDVGGTTGTSKRSGSRSQLALDIVGLISEGGRGTDSGVMSVISRWTSGSGDWSETMSVGDFEGGVGALSTGGSMANERGVLASEGIVLHRDAVS